MVGGLWPELDWDWDCDCAWNTTVVFKAVVDAPVIPIGVCVVWAAAVGGAVLR